MLTVPDPTGQEPQGIFPHLESPLVRDLMLLLEYDASPECAPHPLNAVSRTPFDITGRWFNHCVPRWRCKAC